MSAPFVPAVAPDQVRTVACVGTGVIGGGWVAHFLARGYDVVTWDPGPDAEARRAARGRCGLAGADRARAGSGCVARPAAHGRRARGRRAALADFVQESGPEDRELKRRPDRRRRQGHPDRCGDRVVDVGLRHGEMQGRPRTPSAPWSGTRSTRRT